MIMYISQKNSEFKNLKKNTLYLSNSSNHEIANNLATEINYLLVAIHYV